MRYEDVRLTPDDPRLMESSAKRSALAQFGVGYSRMPGVGAIESLHAIDPATNLTLCGQSTAIRWSAEDAAETEIDCARCRYVIANRGGGV
jgi:hypothetical protein